MKRKLNNEELITFCSQMALILKSGISSLEGIYIMEDGDVSGDGREILKEIREEIEMCGMLYPAMKKSGVLGSLFISVCLVIFRGFFCLNLKEKPVIVRPVLCCS